jgi:hypothetical protein
MEEMKGIRSSSITVGLAAVMLTLCSGLAQARIDYTMKPIPAESQTVRWENGDAQFDSRKDKSHVSVQYLQVEEGKLFFLVTVKNVTTKELPGTIDFDVEAISLKDSKGTPVKIYTREELIKSITFWRNTKKVLGVIGATAGVLASISAAQRGRSGSGVDSSGRRFTYSESGTDAGALVLGSAASIVGGAYVLKSANKNAEEKIKYLNESYLAKQTLNPSEELIKIVQADRPKDGRRNGGLALTISILGEDHVFGYEWAKG